MALKDYRQTAWSEISKKLFISRKKSPSESYNIFDGLYFQKLFNLLANQNLDELHDSDDPDAIERMMQAS